MPFKKGHKKLPTAGRKLGTSNKTTSLKQLFQDSLDRNKDKAIKLLDEFYDNPKDFKWVMELKASLEPKNLENIGDLLLEIISYAKSKQ